MLQQIKGFTGRIFMNQILPIIILGKNYPLTHSLVLTLETFNGLLFVNLHGEEYNTDTLYHFDGNNWVVFEQESSNVSIKSSSQQLVLTRRFNVSVYDQDLNRTHNLYSGRI